MSSTTWAVDLGNDDVQRHCLCATNEAIWWVSTAKVLYVWRDSHNGERGIAADAEVPDPVPLAQLDSPALFMTVSPDDTMVLATPHYVSLYAVRREYTPLFLQDDGHGGAEGGTEMIDHDDDKGRAAVMRITVEETQRLPCRVSDVRAGDVNGDASCIAFATMSGLLVVNCAVSASGEEEEGVMPRSGSSSSSRAKLFECTQLGASTRGCRFVCFSGITRLVLLDDVNHLLLLHCVAEQETADGEKRCSLPTSGEAAPLVELFVDGHVLTRTARATALVCCHSAVHAPVIVVGFSTGQVRVIDGESLQQLRAWNVSSVLLPRALTSVPTAVVDNADPSRRCQRGSQLSRPQRRGTTALSEAEALLLQTNRASLALPVLDVQVGTHLITIGTPQGVIYYNRHTFQANDEYTFQFDPPLVPLDEEVVRAAEEGLLFRSAANGSWCYTGAVESMLYYAPTPVDVHHAAEQRETDEELAATDIIHARVPLPPAWLNEGAFMQRSPSSPTVSAGRPLARRQTKGSGYGDAPWSVQQARKRKAQEAVARDRKAQEFGLPPKSGAKPLRFLYGDCSTAGASPSCVFTLMEAPTKVLQRLHSRAVHAITFDTAGEALVTAGGDGSAQHLQYPIVRSKRTGGVVGRGLPGHPAAVTSVDANLSRQQHRVVTGCADGRVRLWAPGVQDAPVAVCTTGAVSEATGGRSCVTCAQFFYLDNFVLSCTRDFLELRRYVSASAATPAPMCLSTRPVFRYSVGASHAITSASAVNHFSSNVVVLATSEKEIQVLDITAGAALWSNSNMHTRTIYRVVLGRNNRYATSMSTTAAHLFASAALDGTVALWDLRVRSPVQLYTQHSNSAIPSLGLELSPGNEMMAVASQDSRVYVYDIRRGGGGGGDAAVLTVLQGLDTYVMSIAWHPLQPTLAIGLANGDVQLFHHRA
jgi:WD40 repeat protein